LTVHLYVASGGDSVPGPHPKPMGTIVRLKPHGASRREATALRASPHTAPAGLPRPAGASRCAAGRVAASSSGVMNCPAADAPGNGVCRTRCIGRDEPVTCPPPGQTSANKSWLSVSCRGVRADRRASVYPHVGVVQAVADVCSTDAAGREHLLREARVLASGRGTPPPAAGRSRQGSFSPLFHPGTIGAPYSTC
jgi:hypothetical protein